MHRPPDADTVLFQYGTLTVLPTKLVLGQSDIYYHSISGTRLYRGRPFLPWAIPSALGSLVGLWFVDGMMKFLPGMGVSLLWWTLLLSLCTEIAFALYRVQMLLVCVNGRWVPVLAHRDSVVLEEARQAIDNAMVAG